MTVTEKTTHVEEALANRIEQFKDATNVGSMITSYVEQLQELEAALFQILTETTLDTSVGQQLDNLGAIVGEQRFGRSDDQYRTAIAARIQLNTTEGTLEQMIGLIRAIAGPVTVQIIETFPAGFIAQILDPVDTIAVDIESVAIFVSSGKPAGVRGLLVYATDTPFQYDTGLGYDEGEYAGATEL